MSYNFVMMRIKLLLTFLSECYTESSFHCCNYDINGNSQNWYFTEVHSGLPHITQSFTDCSILTDQIRSCHTWLCCSMAFYWIGIAVIVLVTSVRSSTSQTHSQGSDSDMLHKMYIYRTTVSILLSQREFIQLSGGLLRQ